jgi:hypothetical protein
MSAPTLPRALAGDGLANLELVTHIGERAADCIHHYRPRSGARTLCGHTCDDDGAYGDWVADPDAHPEDACGLPGEVCSSCDASYRKAQRVAHGEGERKRDGRPAWKRDNALPRIRPAVVPKPSSSDPVPPGAEVFRMYRHELEALGTPEALAELKRRPAKRAQKRAERVAA